MSFDIKSLFTNVPVQEVLGVIHRKLLADESLGKRTALSADQVTHLLHICLQTTYFLYKGEYYQQKDGAAMGSPVSPVVTNINVELFNDLALKTKLAPRIWEKYVDDTFCVIEEVNTRHFLNQLNSLRPSIQFTMELEKEGSLPFLDTLPTRREDSRMDIEVYQKPTHRSISALHFSQSSACQKVCGLMPIESCQNRG